jgi:GTP-binding protein
MKILNANFVTGIVKGNQQWESYIPQIAFYGRSNAGKSSSINVLLGNSSLARTSAVPGKTTEINLYSANDESVYVFDLPGYGFARGSAEKRKVLQDLVHWFIKDTRVKNRIHVMVLDAKVGLTEVDKETFSLCNKRKNNYSF